MSQFIRLQFPDVDNGAEFNSSKPPYSDLDYDKSLVFANRNLVLNLDNTNHTVAKFRISWTGNVDYASICFYDGNGSMVSVSDSPGGLYKVCFPPDMYLENTFKDEQNYTQNKEYYVVLNGDPSQKTDTLNIVVSVASNNLNINPSAEVSILYDCNHAPVYEYTTGMHAYSPYDAKAGTAALTTKLYSTTPIADWSSGTKTGLVRRGQTKIWQNPLLSTPAMPYFYGYDDKVYQVGTELDRSYGIKTQVVSHKPKYSFKRSWRTETIGPQSFYDDSDPNNETSQACIEPTLSGVGKLRKIFTASTLPQPQQYRYYMGYHATNKRESNDSVFTKYILADKKHYPITGFQHATEKMVSAVFSGFNRNLKPLFIGAAALGVAGLALLVPAVGTAIASTAAGVSAFFSGLIGPFAPALISLGSSFGGAMAAVASVAPYILLAAALIYAAVKFFSNVTKVYKEDCKNFLHHFTTNPYIGTGDVLYKDNNLSIVNNGFYCDGVNYYQQSGGSVTTKELSFTNALVNEDPKEFKFVHSVQADEPTLVEDLGKLILLPYASGKPMPYCGGSTVYYSSLKTQTITTECCDFETCDPVTIEIPYGSYVSCISQQEADDQAEEQLEQAVGWAEAQGTYITATEPATDFNAHFTHQLKIEDRPNVTAVFYTGSIGIGNTLYYDAFGCHKVLDGYYTTGSSTYYKEFYHTTDGVIDSIEYITDQNILSTDSGIPLLGSDLNFTSNWFISGSSKYVMDAYTNQNWFWNRNFDTTTIKTNSPFKPVTGYIISSSYNNFRVFPSVDDTGSTSEASSGYYKPLIDWYYQDSFYYNAVSSNIILTPTEVCTFDLDSPLRQFSINSTLGDVAYEASNPLVVDYTVVYTSSEYQALPSEHIIPVAPETASQLNLDGVEITNLATNIFPLDGVLYYQEISSNNSNVEIYRNTTTSLPLSSDWGDSSRVVIDKDLLNVSRVGQQYYSPLEVMFKSGSNELFAFGSYNFLHSTDNGLTWSQLPTEAVDPNDSWKVNFDGVGTYAGAWMDGDSILVTSPSQIGGGTIVRYWYSETRGQTWHLTSSPAEFGGMNMANSPGINGGDNLHDVVSHNGKWFVNVNSAKQLVSTTTPEDDTSWIVESTENDYINGLWVSDTHLFMALGNSELIRYNLDSSGNLSNRKSVGNTSPHNLDFKNLGADSSGDNYKHQRYIPDPSELVVRSDSSSNPVPFDFATTYVSRDLGDNWTQINFSQDQGQQVFGTGSFWGGNASGVNLFDGIHFDSTSNAYFASQYGMQNIGILSGRGLGLVKKLVGLYSGSYNGSTTLNPNLSENLVDFNSSINGDTNEIDIILSIPGSNRIGNIEYSISDYESCNIDNIENCGIDIETISNDPSKSFPRKQAIYLSNPNPGEVTISFTSSVVPVKPIFEYNGTIIGDGGYRGSQIYQTDLNNELTRRGESTQTISSRYYEVTFTKNSFIPDFVTASFYAPLSSSSWNYRVSCPVTQDPSYEVIPNVNTVYEGETVSFEITTENIPTDTVLYYTIMGSTPSSPAPDGSDFTDGSINGSIQLVNNVATITKTLTEDNTTEGDEIITFQLRTDSITGTIVATSPPVIIGDTSLDLVPTYDISPNRTTADEGDSITWTITTSDIAANSTLYYTNNGTTNGSDFTDGLNEGSIVLSNNTATLTKTLVEDLTTEGDETIILQLRTDSTAGTVVATAPTVTARDTSIDPGPSYDISPDKIKVGEFFDTITWTITTKNIAADSTLYYTNAGTVDNDDFDQSFNEPPLEGSIQLVNNEATLTKQTTADSLTEGDETIILQLRTDSTAGTVVATSPTVTLSDDSIGLVLYELYIHNNISGVDRYGNPHYFQGRSTFTTEAGVQGYTPRIYLGQTEIVRLKGRPGRTYTLQGFTLVSAPDEVTPVITLDSANLSVRTQSTSRYTNVFYDITIPTDGNSGVGRIEIEKDPTYDQVYNISPNRTTADEGDSITWTINTENIPANTVLYYSNEGTTNGSDFNDQDNSGVIILSNNTATLTKTITPDLSTEGDETIVLKLRKFSRTGPIVATSPTVTVKDTSNNLDPSYDISPNRTTVNEGDSVTWTIITSDIPADSTLYYTNLGDTNSSDFTDGVNQGSIQLSNNEATLTKTLTEDATTEGSQDIILQLRTNSVTGTVVATAPTVTVKDTSRKPAWSNVDPLNTARSFGTAVGAQNATVFFGGTKYPSPIRGCTTTEEYDGNVWNNSAPMSEGRLRMGGAGTQDAALAVGGALQYYTYSSTNESSCTEEYSNNTWATGCDLNTPRGFILGMSSGTQDAALVAGGYRFGDNSSLSATEEYNGNAWTTSPGTLCTPRHSGTMFGTQNSSRLVSGYPYGSPTVRCTEEYNGTSWSTGDAVNNPRFHLAGAGTTADSGVVYGEGNRTEEYNGISWTETYCMNQSSGARGGSGTKSAALAVGGWLNITCTEAYNP